MPTKLSTIQCANTCVTHVTPILVDVDRSDAFTGPASLDAPAGPAGPEASPGARRWLGLTAIEPAVRDLRPDYTALIIVAEGLRPGPSDAATDALLSDAEARARAALAGLSELGPDGLLAAGQDMASQLAALHPGARLSWRQVP